MRTNRTAIGYLRRDIAGAQQSSNEAQIRSLAKRLGYDLTKTIVFSANTDRPTDQLIEMVNNLGINAVFTPGVDHLDSAIPAGLVATVDVITVHPEFIHSSSIEALPKEAAERLHGSAGRLRRLGRRRDPRVNVVRWGA
ncbi:hypothetical protein [Nocardia vaccinii]|uniref:hypothetical protein n=1 Tax=Nocardia vaccinii TaxID=1822 RepID=UPI00082C61E8|nr:hypothetical protein [Nocardia vaccinii]